MARSKNTPMIVGVAFVGCLVVVAILGILAAVGIPAFLGSADRAKTVEAEVHLDMIAVGLESYRSEYGTYPQRSFAPTPPNPGRVHQMWPFGHEPGWAEIGFAPPDPVYYSYEYEPAPDALGYTIRARGDLDGDGEYSLFQRTSDSPTIHLENELE